MQDYLDQYFHARYLPSDKNIWKGRPTDPSMGAQYWYQLVEMLNLNHIKNEQLTETVVLIGYMCDEGVRRNQGRVGTNEAPMFIREKLAKIPVHYENKKVLDIGDIACVDGNVEGCQAMLGETVYRLLYKGAFPVVLGGGHDVAFGHFTGIAKFAKEQQKTKVGIINLDAHFDLRPVEGKRNSGTPFNQILNEFNGDLDVRYLAVGIQQQSNTKELFTIADQLGVDYILNEDCEDWRAVEEKLKVFSKGLDYIYLSIDIDAFSVAYAPGVSAPSPFGLTPLFAQKVIGFLKATNKLISGDVAEMNPEYDRDGQTASLAARLVDRMVQ